MFQTTRRLLLGLSLAPFAAAVLVHVVPAPAAALSAAKARPPLVFSQYAVNLRDAPPRPLLQAHFDFENRGTTPVTIGRLDASCGCLRPQLVAGKTVYQPGEMGRFYLSIDTAANEPGPHAYDVSVHYDDGRPHVEQVTFRVDIPEIKVSVQPPEVYFYQLSGEAGVDTIYVSDRRDGEINVMSAESTSDLVNVEILPSESDADGKPRIPIRLTVPGVVPAGRETGYIVITTDDPDFVRMRAAFLIEGAGEILPAGHEQPAE